MRAEAGPARILAGYIVWGGLAFALFYLIALRLFSLEAPSSTGNAAEKIAWYGRHRGAYDLLFVGDSRTYTDIQPDVLDPLLGSRSLNLAVFAHWFPTQYPSFRKLVELVPPGTTVVWSIGHQNFFPSGQGINRNYPLRITDVPAYLRWGFSPADLLPNWRHHDPIAGFFGYGGDIREKLNQARRLEVCDFGGPAAGAQSPPAVPPDIAAPIAEMIGRANADPAVTRVEITKDGVRATSLVLYKRAGAYFRVELDPGFFRGKQQEDALARAGRSPDVPREPDPAYWNLFVAILETFRRSGVRLVVNEFEEAPYVYRPAELRAGWRAFMREKVAPEVEKRGFAYVRVDFDPIGSDDYFDFNHLNSDGVAKFSPAFASALRPHLDR